MSDSPCTTSTAQFCIYVEDTVPPPGPDPSTATRGTAVVLPPPDLGRCINGLTEFGFVPCTTLTAVTAPPPALPVTGAGTSVGLGFAVAFVAVGAALIRVARRA